VRRAGDAYAGTLPNDSLHWQTATVMPAKAGIQAGSRGDQYIPVSAGMTNSDRIRNCWAKPYAGYSEPGTSSSPPQSAMQAPRALPQSDR
jgi:hypothetical protein